MTTAARTSWLTKVRLAVRRSWRLHRHHYVDARDFGARYDGIHDDGPAMRDAMAYGMQHGCGQVRVPAGCTVRLSHGGGGGAGHGRTPPRIVPLPPSDAP